MNVGEMIGWHGCTEHDTSRCRRYSYRPMSRSAISDGTYRKGERVVPARLAAAVQFTVVRTPAAS